MAYDGPNPYPIAAGGTGATTAIQARSNLGLAIGTNVQAFDATLQSISALGTAADRMLYTTGVDTWAEAPITTFGRSLVNSANSGAAQTTLGLVIGTNVQAFDATLQSISALGTAADRMIYTTGIDTWAEAPITTYGRSLVNSANAGAAQTTLGLVIGTNVQAFDATLQSISALGTAADRMIYTTGIDTWAEAPITTFGRSLVNSSNAAAAQTTLGLLIGTNVQAQDATLQSISALGTAADKMIYTTGVDTWAESNITSFGRLLANLSAANFAVLGTNGSGVPSMTQTPQVSSVTFNGTDILNAYTIGTWTPTITGSTTNPTPTYVNQSGTYVKIGRLVYVVWNIQVSALTGGSGSIQVASFPFTSQNIAAGNLMLCGVITVGGNPSRTIFSIVPNSTICRCLNTDTTNAQLPATTVTFIQGSGVYMASS